MITLDAVRTALAAPDPFTRMDQLVRAEMANGRKVSEIIEQFKPVVDDALDTPDLSEDSEEALLGTLDALMGNCRADQRYFDPPNTSLPTEAEIAKLPRWARVAFAARCARRVSPLLALYGEGQRRFTVETYLEMAAVVESAAAKATVPAGTSLLEASHLSVAFWDGDPLETATGVVLLALNASRNQPETRLIMGVMSKTVEASRPIADVTETIRRDFNQLTASLNTHDVNDDSPVPPEVFGPLWPDGPPKDWPADPDAPQHSDISLEVVSREGLDERIVENEVVNLFNAMNRYHIARGGQPLSLEDLQPLISALVPAGG